jgi:hypothetical protein
MMGSAPDAVAAPSEADREAYRVARAAAGTDADAQVRLALWCEARGLESERARHLAQAVLANPAHAAARGLLGLVSEAGRWARPETIAERTRNDPERAARRAAYSTRRASTPYTADDQARLALWCESQGLDDEAIAHYTAVTRLDPAREMAWKKLGCRKFEGRWMTPAQITALKADRETQASADKLWLPRLEAWRDALNHATKRLEAESALLKLDDPRAVPMIAKVFARGGAKDQSRAVVLFAQIDSDSASRALAALAIQGETPEVRRAAIETLRGRDVRGTLGLVINLLRQPVQYQARPNLGPNEPGMLIVEGKKANYQRAYGYELPNITASNARFMPDLFNRWSTAANERLTADIRSIESTNANILQTNDRALTTLRGVTGVALDADRNAWMGWWADRLGYAFKEDDGQTRSKPTFTEFVNTGFTGGYDCFAAGTLVETQEGQRRIESVRAGDRVLTQDPTTGLIRYQPTLAAFHYEPAPTIRLRLAGDELVVTPIHRFWKAGKGWTMARELRPGDMVRHLGGITRVESSDPDRIQPIFNLEVAGTASFFVGRLGCLVHDNTLVEPVDRPFDGAQGQAPALEPRR